jgi:hypothetical protein
MNLFNFLHGDTALVLAVLSGLVQPFFSALLTKAPSFLTGALTALQAALAGFLAEWAANPDRFDWKQALGTALGAWLVAVVTHKSVLDGTHVQRRLHKSGVKG